MNIHWYPGHMAKARKLIQENLKLVDMVLEIRDARIPLSSANPDLEELMVGKTRVVALNKADLAEPSATEAWINWFQLNEINAIAINSLDFKNADRMKKFILDIAEEKAREILDKKGIHKTIRGMVVGIPNVGKSTFINSIAGGKKAKTGNRPGVTKGKQWIKISRHMDLLDTPGLLWPKIHDQNVALHLAYTKTIKEEILDPEEIAHHFLEEMKTLYPNAISQRYGVKISEEDKGYEILEAICLKKGWIKSGGISDTARGASHLLDDFQMGRLGRITLEWPKEI